MRERLTDQNASFIKKKLSIILTVSISAVFLLSTLLLSPLLIITSSDVIYQGTLWPDLIELLIGICDISAYAIGFSVIIYSIYRLSSREAIRSIVIYCTAVLLKYTVNIVVTTLFESRFDISYLAWPVLYFFFDLIIVFCVYFIARASFKSTGSFQKDLLPFNTFFSSHNPLQVSVLKVGVLLAAIKIATRLVYDFSYGLPQDIIDALWMLAYYISDILICIVVYLISLLIFIKLNKKLN